MDVVLFKSVPEDTTQPDKFQEALKSENIAVHLVPVISFNYCNLDKLKEKLKAHVKYEGIIFSSPRCVSSCEKALENFPSIREEWVAKRMFCVGRSTAECARKLIPGEVISSPYENAESLGTTILETLKGSNSPPSLLYPCGNLKTDTIQKILSDGNITTDSITVYETVENPDLLGCLSSLSVGEKVPFTFFSPSGLKYAWKHAETLILGDNRPLIAIGPTTKDALLNLAGVQSRNIYQCNSPSPEALLECLNRIRIT